jgi:hypothetical protein
VAQVGGDHLNSHYSRAHILQMKVLLLAGYETTSSEFMSCPLLSY